MLELMKKKGLMIAFLGTDGSGKSSIIDAVSPVLKTGPYARVRYGHLRPTLLPPLAVVFGRARLEGPVVDPHGGQPSGFFGSLLRITYYTLDYILGYWFKIYPAMAREDCLWVFDRYFYDYLFDPKRSLIALPEWIIRSFVRFIPQPDLILCLGTDARKIHGRKPELPLEEIERQLSVLKKLCNRSPQAVWIDTGRTIEESAADASSAIAAYLTVRDKG